MGYRTYNLKECIDDCQYYEYGDYFWCYTTDNSWDYCSPLADLTNKNEKTTHYYGEILNEL